MLGTGHSFPKSVAPQACYSSWTLFLQQLNTPKMNKSNSDIIYHEKQVKELCALHALNNLFQEKQAFTKRELDEICRSLTPDVWINPHRSILGLGNYDVNVIMTALQRRGCEAFWFDKRKDPSCIQLDYISGFILNVPSDYRLGFVPLPLRRRHWIAIRQVDGLYYNLDSKLDSPTLIGSDEELLVYLRHQLNNKQKELFIVVSAANHEKWMKEDKLIVLRPIQRTEDDIVSR